MDRCRFAAPLGIRLGVDPSLEMSRIAQKRGIDVVHGRAEDLPFDDTSMDFVLMVTTLCFLDDVEQAFAEFIAYFGRVAFLLWLSSMPTVKRKRQSFLRPLLFRQ